VAFVGALAARTSPRVFSPVHVSCKVRHYKLDLTHAQAQPLGATTGFESRVGDRHRQPMFAHRLDHLDAFEFLHSRRDEATLVHGEPLENACCQRALQGTKPDISNELKPDITYMVASHLQGDIVFGEEGGCGLISGLDRGLCPPAPMDFAAKVLI
jgi:hypothetical protein